jgi:predicted nucleic acid-binding protein
LKRSGTSILSNDIWIAAQTMETGAELITMDKHFEKIEGLIYRFFHLESKERLCQQGPHTSHKK